MKSDSTSLLALTAIEETWDYPGELIFLGEWCKLYERKSAWEKLSYSTLKFHWDDRLKLEDDYFYLASVHQSLLKSLSEYLNKLHGTDYAIRYWQMLLDPWLVHYVGIMFDRWESIRLAMESLNKPKIIYVNLLKETEVSFCWAELLKFATSDEWNQSVYQRILSSNFADKCEFIDAASNNTGKSSHSDQIPKEKSQWKKRAVKFLLSSYEKLFNSDFVFLSPGFSFAQLIRLQLSLGQLPKLFFAFKVEISEADFIDDKLIACDRNEGNIDYLAKTPFEIFIKRYIVQDLPKSVMEYFYSIKGKSSNLKGKAKIIATAGDHWGNLLSKFWIADQVNNGAKLVIVEHGGSFQVYRDTFYFEESIADKKITWFTPFNKKHVQLSPSKYIGKIKESVLQSKLTTKPAHLVVIGTEYPRWVVRTQFYPMSYQVMRSFDYVIQFNDQLDSEVSDKLLVKPYHVNAGWNTHSRFLDKFGYEKVARNISLSDAFLKAKIIVCTYPETTFADAMFSDIPVILLYPDEFNKLHPVCFDLLRLLISERIVFHSPYEAAKHINAIWEDPALWWHSPNVLHARTEFRRQALNLKTDWVKEWKNFLYSVMD